MVQQSTAKTMMWSTNFFLWSVIEFPLGFLIPAPSPPPPPLLHFLDIRFQIREVLHVADRQVRERYFASDASRDVGHL